MKTAAIVLIVFTILMLAAYGFAIGVEAMGHEMCDPYDPLQESCE